MRSRKAFESQTERGFHKAACILGNPRIMPSLVAVSSHAAFRNLAA